MLLKDREPLRSTPRLRGGKLFESLRVRRLVVVMFPNVLMVRLSNHAARRCVPLSSPPAFAGASSSSASGCGRLVVVMIPNLLMVRW